MRNSKLWSGLASVFAAILVVAILGQSLALTNASYINSALGISTTRIEYTGEVGDTTYFKSSFGDFNDPAAQAAALAAALEQNVNEMREGAALLMNENNVLPLTSATRISVFGHAAVDPAYQANSAGTKVTDGAPYSIDLKTALEAQGYVVNQQLWDGIAAGSATRRQGPEAAWGGGYTVTGTASGFEENKAFYQALSNTWASDYKDAAIVVFAREGGEGVDLTMNDVDDDGSPARGLELHKNERDLLEMVEKFDALVATRHYPWKLRDVLPQVLTAGENAGQLTESGAKFLDPAGDLLPGIPVAPCEGDAGTGMAATNSVRVRTGNVSAGTSDFAMVVVNHALGVHREIDMVTTPSGSPVAMVHCNNCTSDINAWVNLFSEFASAIGAPMEKGKLFPLLFNKALEGDPDCGGLLSYNYFSGEGVTGLDEGRPLFLRVPDGNFTLANFMRTHLLSALATLKIGLDILTAQEKVPIDKLYGHGGFFKTPGVGQRMLSAAVGAPVSVMETAGEGGPYGMALLVAYMLWKDEGEALEDYLENKVFAGAKVSTLTAEAADVVGFSVFLTRYQKALPVEKLVTEVL